MKDWKYYLFFLILIACLILYSTYYYNEFLIAQGVIVLIFLFSQFIQFRMFKENAELLRKQFKQDSHNRERFNIITKVDKDILKLLESLAQLSFDVKREDYEDKQYDKDKNELNNHVYILDHYVKTNRLFFGEKEFEILGKINKSFIEFAFFETTGGDETIRDVETMHKELIREFQKSLEL